MKVESKQLHQQRLMQILLASHVSEKSTLIADKHRQFVFKVVATANKAEVKQAVELLFEVKVDDVRIVNVKGKTRRFGQIHGRRKDWKKAYVKLAEGHDIQFATNQ